MEVYPIVTISHIGLVLENLDLFTQRKSEARGISIISGPKAWNQEFMSRLLGQPFPKLTLPGIYTWKNPLFSPDQFFTYTILPKSPQQSAKLFTIVYLISEVVIYNIRGGIDIEAIHYLGFLRYLNKYLNFKDTLGMENHLLALCPSLIWTLSGVGNFLLEIIESDEYLLDVLNQEYDVHSNEILTILNKHFVKKDLVTLPNENTEFEEACEKLFLLTQKPSSKKLGNKTLTFEFIKVLLKFYTRQLEEKQQVLLSFS